MPGQFSVFKNLATLLVTIWVVFYTYHAARTYKKPYLKHFFVFCVTWLFFNSHLYVWRYISVNLVPNVTENLHPVVENTNDLVFSLVALVALVSLFQVVLAMGRRGAGRRLWWPVCTTAVVIVAGYGARMFAPWGMRVFGWFDTVAYYVTIRVFYYQAFPAALALYLGYRRADADNAPLLRGFGAWFLLGQASRWFPNLLWYAGVRGLPVDVLGTAAMLFSNLVPYLWLRRVVVPRLSGEKGLTADPAVFDAVAEKYNISKREREVIRLILDGKSNREIQDSLVVSIHTVKNHIYNIYKKLGVNSRYSLIHFMTRDRDPG